MTGFEGRCRVFLSHQWADKHLADGLSRDLEKFAEVWLDVRRIEPGRSIQEQIDQAVGEMDAVLLLWSSHSAASEGVRKEIRTALRLGKPIVPLFIEHGADGRPRPPLPEEIHDHAGFDFHHYGMGLARLANHLVTLNRAKLPADAAKELEDLPAARLMKMMTGDADVLRNMNATGEGNRDYYVEQISERMANWFRDDQGPEAVARMLESLESAGSSNPDHDVLRRKLQEALKSDAGSAPPPLNTAEPRTRYEPPPAPAPDELRKRLAALIPGPQVEAIAQGVSAYVAAAGPILRALTAYAHQQGSSAGIQVVHAMTNYLNEENDLIPDSLGDYGAIDDAWLVVNTAYRLVEAGIVPANVVPADWNGLTNADQIVRALMPPQALQTLSNLLLSYLQAISAEVAAYSPQMVPSGRGYEPHLGGGCWEDEMNRMLLGTGLSV